MQLLFNKLLKKIIHNTHNEKGIYLPIMAFGIVALLGVAGLSLDVANLYYSHIQLQKAADIAVVAGLDYRIINGPTVNGVINDNDVEQRANEIATANINFNMRNINGPPNINVVYNQLDENLTVTPQANINLLLLSFVPLEILNAGSIADTLGLDASATGEIKPAYVSLILDFSSSMACPDTIVHGVPYECPCLSYDGPDPNLRCPARALEDGTKLRAMIDGVNEFLQRFKPGRDRVSIVPYNLSATVFNSLTKAFTTDDRDLWNWNDPTRQSSLVSLINGGALSLGDWTNPSDGLLTSFEDMQSFASATGQDQFYVILSDGAPTAGTFNFVGAGRQIMFSNFYPAVQQVYEPMGPTLPILSGPRIRWLPGPLIPTGPQHFSLTYNSTKYKTDPVYQGELADEIDFPNFFSQDINQFDISNTSLLYLPDADGWIPHIWENETYNLLTPSYTCTTTTPGNPATCTLDRANTKIDPIDTISQNYIRMYYNAAISYSDSIRDSGGFIFSIGYGPEDRMTWGGNCGPGVPEANLVTPYQNYHDSNSRKDFFLARLAGDTNSRFQTTCFDMGIGNQEVEFSDFAPGLTSRWNTIPQNQRGQYRIAEDRNQLLAIMEQIAKMISRLNS